MLNSFYTPLEALQFRVNQLAQARYQDGTLLEGWQIVDGLNADTQRPAADDPRWEPLAHGGLWRGRYAWLRFELPPLEPGRQAVLRLELFGYDQPPADRLGLNKEMRPEATVCIPGMRPQVINRGHREVWLEGAHTGTVYVHAAGGYTDETRRLHRAELAYLDVEVDGLYWDAATLVGLCDGGVAPDEAKRLMAGLERAFAVVDWRNLPSVGNATEARRILSDAAFRGEGGSGRVGAGPLIHAVGHAHIDLGWLWPLSYSVAKGVRTFRTQLNLMERFPQYTFLQSQPQLYEAVRHADPEMFSEILTRIRDGRWNATGAMWVEPDVNLPNGESLVRQLVRGMRYFRQVLGVEPKVLWLPDTFGFSGALPQLMRLSNVPYFFTSKMSWNAVNKLPNDTFIWQGIDGSEVLAHMATTHRQGRAHTSYETNLLPYEAADTWTSYKNQDLSRHVLVAYGYGDGGGGPDRDSLERVARYRAGVRGMADLRESTAEAFFEALEAEIRQKMAADPRFVLPRWVGELYFELHRGCYTSQAATKRHNRKLEVALHDAEFIRAWAYWAAGLDYPREALEAAWDVLLTNQFHDILPGSSIREAYQEAEAQYARALHAAAAAGREGLAALSGLIPPPPLQAGETSRTVVVFNTLGHARTEVVEVSVSGGMPPGKPFSGIIRTGTGEVCPWQYAVSNAGLLVQIPHVPAYGYSVLYLVPGDDAVPTMDGTLSASTRHLENDVIRVEFDSAGNLTRVYDKRASREVLQPGAVGNQFQLFQDLPARWDAWEIDPAYEESPLPAPVLEDVRVTACGAVRAGVTFRWRMGRSTLQQMVSLEAGSALVRFDTEVDWQERHTLLKVAFPLDLHAARAMFEVQFGAVERPTHRNTSWDTARFEVPAQRWADLSEAAYGVALLNDCKYGYDVRQNVIRLTLLRAPTAPDPEADQGLHKFTYGLLPHLGDWRYGVVHEAAGLNAPLWATVRKVPSADDPAVPTNEDLPSQLVWVKGAAVLVDTVKLAEDGNSLIVRAYEPDGSRQWVSFGLGLAAASVELVNLLEDTLPETPTRTSGGLTSVTARSFSTEFRPFEVKTFRIQVDSGKASVAPQTGAIT